MVKKRILAIIIAASLMCGCSRTTAQTVYDSADTNTSTDAEIQDDAETDLSEADISDSSNEASSESIEAQDSEDKPEGDVVSETYGTGYASWQEAYIKYIEESFADIREFEYALIYLDDNDIPELYINTEVEAGGEIVASYDENRLCTLQLGRIGSEYVPKTGLIYNNCGHMDWYPVYIYKLHNGDFYQIGEGIWGGLDWENGVETDENGDLNYQYEWEGTRYTEEEFYAQINELFPLDEGTRAEEWYNQEELLSVLKTGHHTAYGHRYELFIGDMTWNEAQQACIDKGGYLATITSPEERKEIASLIESQGMTDYSFYVGYKAFCRIDGELQDSGWVEKDGSLADGHAFTDFYFYYYPGYDSQPKEWDFTLGQIGLMKYATDTGKIYMFEAPMDLLMYAPQYAGKLGYICEYEE